MFDETNFTSMSFVLKAHLTNFLIDMMMNPKLFNSKNNIPNKVEMMIWDHFQL